MNDWQADKLLPGFESKQLEFPDDYDGPVITTLVRRLGPRQPKAVLYVHGFIDYFFQAFMADRFFLEGFTFYAVDLRKHGRSLLAHQHPNFCKYVAEYFADITRAIDIIGEESGNEQLLLAGHSTGGLTCSLYAHGGERRSRIAALWLNSPFFEFNVPTGTEFIPAFAAAIGRFAMFLTGPRAVSPFYPMSLHKDYCGEWDFDLNLKPIEGFCAYFGWVRAIRAAHAQVQAGLAIGCPVLSMHSDKSDGGKEWKESFRVSDIVLNVEHIKRWSPELGRDVTLCEIRDGLHDLVLSRKDVRGNVFGVLFSWLRNRTVVH